MKIAVYSAYPFELAFLEAYKAHHILTLIEEELDEHNAHLAKDCDAVMLFTSDKANAAVLELLGSQGIKAIALLSTGYDHVDLAKAAQLGIRIANVPSYSPYAVAEHAVAMLMALNRKLIPATDLIRQQDFRLDGLTGFDLHTKTVGVVGLGNIGKVFSKIMNGFGCQVICHDIAPDYVLEKELNLRFVSLEELCQTADIISIHCPLSPATHHLFNERLFNLMKKNMFIINTARGAIINTVDLISALESGIVGAAGIDVYEFEKGLFFNDHRNIEIKDLLFVQLSHFKNVLITSHQGFLTEIALQNISEMAFHNLACFEKNIPCENALLP
jgi:D-lactate dehydrogenase